MNPYALQNYLFAPGSRHQVVKTIKQFLNEHPRVRASDLRLNFEFDAPTQAALAEYQNYKFLLSKDGRMNIETYRAIGADMVAGQIKAAVVNNPALRLLLADSNFGTDDDPWAGDAATPLPRCVRNGIYEFYKARGNSSAARLQLIEKALKNVLLSATGFPLSTPPGIALEAQAATDAIGGVGAYEKLTGTNPQDIQGYTSSATRIYLTNKNVPLMRTAEGMALITHEFTHVMQYLEEKNFSVNYVKEMMKYGSGEGKNRFEKRAYINQKESLKFYLNNPQLMCNESYSN